MVWEEARWGEYGRPFEPVDYDVVDRHDAVHPSKGGGEDDDDKTTRDGRSGYSTRWWPNPLTECGIRTTEHLTYDRWGSFTPSSYRYRTPKITTVEDCPCCPRCPRGHDARHDGPGEPHTWHAKVSVKPDRLSAVVFLSGSVYHAVEDMRMPGRVAFAN
mmetsp:Transcript_38908/g.93600  ORF Transcript_38908/g.93600 Transcript_38908/m.93600 type:complete len:159 (+) Transcript_38908:878-1354(+)